MPNQKSRSILYASSGRSARDPGPSRSLIAFWGATLAFAALCSVFILHPFTPGFPEAGLDPSWIAVIGEEAARHTRWGIDLDFTYGAASPLVTNYFNGQYLALSLPLMLLFSLLHGFCAAVLLVPRRDPSRARSWKDSAPGLPSIACYCGALVAARANPDAFYFAMIFLVFLVDVSRDAEDGPARAAVLLGVVAAGAIAMSKLSYIFASLPLFLLSDTRSLLRREPPWRVILFFVSFLVADLAYGQRLADVPRFLFALKDIIGGYTDAMSIPGDPRELVAFLVLAAVLLGTTLFVEARSRRPWFDRLVLPLGLAAVLFLVFKAGFVRQDLHTLIGWTSMGLVGLMVALGRVLPRFRIAGAALVVGSLFVLAVVYPFVVVIANDEHPIGRAMVAIYESWFREGPPAELAAMRLALTSPADYAANLARTKEEGWAAIRSKSNVPAFAGTIDIIQSDQSTLIANGLDYHPRPSFQEYFSYAPGLIAANRAFYSGPDAPDWLLFAPGSIDNRMPASAEGALWPLLLRRYEPVQWVGDQLVLKRRPQADDEILGQPVARTALFDEPVAVGGGAVFARITVHPTLLGRLASLLYRAPMLTMTLRYADGREEAFRFIPNLGAGGFVLSPAIVTPSDFALLASGDLTSLAANRVVDVRLSGHGGARFAYAPTIDYAFTPMDVSRLGRTAASDELFRELAGEKRWRNLVAKLGRSGDFTGSVLAFQPPRSVAVPVGAARQVRLRFGIEQGAWTEGKTQGVCFSLALGPQRDPAWTRCLDPSRVEADRGDQTAVVDLPPEIGEVVLKSECRASCDWAWSYLRDVEPIP